MLSQATWDALSANGRKEYAPLVGKTFRHKDGLIGIAKSYTLSGQLFLEGPRGCGYVWADECEEVTEC